MDGEEIKGLNAKKRLDIFVPLIVVAFYLVGFSTGIEAIIAVPARWVEIFAKTVLAVWIVVNLPAMYVVFDRRMMIILFATAVLAVSNILFFPDNQKYFGNTLFNFITVSLPAMLFAYIANDVEWIVKKLISMSRWICLATILIFGLMIRGGELESFNHGKYSMGYGYTCALPALIMLMSFIQKPNMKDLLGSVSLILIIVTFGSRGPLLGIALFGVLFGIHYLLAKRNYLLLAALGILFIIALFGYRSILLELASILDHVGIESRTLRLFLQKGIYMSGRERLYSVLIAEIVEQPLKIRGINAEWQVLGVYAHNLILELIYQGGIIIGGGAVLLIVCSGIDTLLFAPQNSEGTLEMVFACQALTQLMYSSTVWNTYTFWVWIALFLRRKVRQRRMQPEIKVLMR